MTNCAYNPSEAERFAVKPADGLVLDLATGTFYTFEDIEFLMGRPARGNVGKLQAAFRRQVLPQLESLPARLFSGSSH